MDGHTDRIDLVFRRSLDAPVERVWETFTDCDAIRRWWGPTNYTSPVCEIDLRPGGSYLFSMRAPDSEGGQVYYSTGQFEVVERPRRLVFGDYFADSEGHIVPAEEMGMGDGFPAEPRFHLELEPDGSRTLLTLRHPGWKPGEETELAKQGTDQMLDKLVALLAEPGLRLSAEPGLPYVDTDAIYDAPVEEVYRAFIDPALITDWMGPANLRTHVVDWDARSGGSWSFVQTDPDGGKYVFHGVFHEVTENVRIVQTFEWETSVPAESILLDRTDFEALIGGRTRVRTHTTFPSVARRDADLEDMRSGWFESYDRLSALLAQRSGSECSLEGEALQEASCSA
ncbi:MAG: SRPBCC family protein [Anaerolineae bacterium]